MGNLDTNFGFLDGMNTEVLAVGEAKAVFADGFYQIWMKIVDTAGGTDFATLIHKDIVHLTTGGCDNFLDTRRGNPAVLDKVFQSPAGNFSSQRIKRGEADSVAFLDFDLYAGGFFKSADVSAFFADDTAFDAFVRKSQGGDCVFRSIIGGSMEHGGYDDLLS